MRVLCSGDLHIGRRSSRLPFDVDPATISCASAWEAIVEYAIEQAVDLVALSGDLVDQDNRYYEAIGPLERGLRRLGDHGIPTVAVAGNHDFGVLPELASILPLEHFRLLGRGGNWERETFTARDGSRLHVDGWSFPTQHVRVNPLASYTLPVAHDAPVLGLLHTDLDVATSLYAPVALAELRAREVTLWLLGHIHLPSLHQAPGAVPILYPGSPQAMHPGETGVHGAWIVDLASGVTPTPLQVPLATVRYESLEIDVTGARDLEAARALILDRVRQEADALLRGGGRLAHLSLRLTMTGRTPLRRELERESATLAEDLRLPIADATAHVERVMVATRPVCDLEALSTGSDAASLLASLLLDLERGTGLERHRALMDAVGRVPAALRNAKPYRSLQDSEALGDAAMRDTLARQAALLLDQLLAQREEAA